MFDPITTSTDAFWPLSLSQFTTYVLVPFVVVHLIQQDLCCSISAAYEEMMDSADVGARFQQASDDDEELDEILKNNNHIARQRQKAT
jgi:RTC4-like domain